MIVYKNCMFLCKTITHPCGLSDPSPVHYLWGFTSYLLIWIGLNPAISNILSALTKFSIILVPFSVSVCISPNDHFQFFSHSPDCTLLRTKTWLTQTSLGCLVVVLSPQEKEALQVEAEWLDRNFKGLITTTDHDWATFAPGVCATWTSQEVHQNTFILAWAASGNNHDYDIDTCAITKDIQT